MTVEFVFYKIKYFTKKHISHAQCMEHFTSEMNPQPTDWKLNWWCFQSCLIFVWLLQLWVEVWQWLETHTEAPVQVLWSGAVLREPADGEKSSMHPGCRAGTERLGRTGRKVTCHTKPCVINEDRLSVFLLPHRRTGNIHECIFSPYAQMNVEAHSVMFALWFIH